jgi:hypothetical protein
MAAGCFLYRTINIIQNGYYYLPNKKLYDILQLLIRRPALYILMQRAVIFNTYRIVRTVNKKCLIIEMPTVLRMSQVFVT